MHGSFADHLTAAPGRIRLRRAVYDALVAARGAKTVPAQARLTGVPPRTLHRVRNGGVPSLQTALRIADALGVELDALFERGAS